jgi:iron-sulfur cluster protein
VSRRDLDEEIRAALTDPSIQAAVPMATRLVAAKRREAVADFSGYEAARDRARAIKERSIEDLPALIERVSEAVEAAGGHVHLASDAADACRRILAIAAEEGCTRAVKSKSMTSEEVHLNAALEQGQVHVRETDLGEYIAQLDDDRPSHILAPILHKSLEDVREAFRRGTDVDDIPDTPEALTQLARRLLREDFLAADLGITGANFVIAESGTVVVVENEGNGRLCTQVPRVHVALAGVEKLIPTLADLEPFLELLPRSATGQLLSGYLSLITGPGWSGSPLADGRRSFHLVLLDNGRMAMRDDPVLREALYCVRCGACLNVCAPYQAVGGHVFGGDTYQSGIGAAWEAGVNGLETAGEFAHLCSTCTRCRDVCPVRIDIPWMNSDLKGRLGNGETSGIGALLREPQRLYERVRSTPGAARLTEFPPVRWYLERSAGIDRRRPLPRLPEQTLSEWHRARGGVVATPASANPHVEAAPDRVVFWADCHAEHAEVPAARAAVEVLEKIGFDVVVATGSCCGRGALSQGDIADARRQSGALVGLLEPFAAAGIPILGLEPSCVSVVAEENARLLPNNADAMMLAVAVQEIFVFLAGRLERLAHVMSTEATERRVVFHGHCQQKTAGWTSAVREVLELVPGLTLHDTAADCCGMAGSYGYRTSTYDVSRELGERLVGEIDRLAVGAGSADGCEVLASGTSCRAQIADVGGEPARHPIELLLEVIE